MAKKRKKASLAKRKASPNSMYWREKADEAWAVEIRAVGKCEYCRRTTGLNAHHIITRIRLRFRHDLSNGICLCSRCHAFDPAISPHIDSFSAENFLRWLKENRPGQWEWYEENKHDKMPIEGTYRDKYEELKEDISREYGD